MNPNQALEALIRRHEEGDRSTELLQQLDTMAQEALLGVPQTELPGPILNRPNNTWRAKPPPRNTTLR